MAGGLRELSVVYGCAGAILGLPTVRRRVAVPIQRLRLMRHPLHFSFNDLPNFNCTKYNFFIYYLASASVRHNLTAIKIVRDDEVKICLLKCIIMNNKDISLTSEQNCIL